jgi:hypothetical protein
VLKKIGLHIIACIFFITIGGAIVLWYDQGRIADLDRRATESAKRFDERYSELTELYRGARETISGFRESNNRARELARTAAIKAQGIADRIQRIKIIMSELQSAIDGLPE